jgi:hypothetical protein
MNTVCSYCKNSLEFRDSVAEYGVSYYRCESCNKDVIEGKNGRGEPIWVIPNALYKDVKEFNDKHGTNCLNYASVLFESKKIAINLIKSNPLENKLYNLISNDLQGILKKLNRPDYSFDFRGLIIGDEFVSFFARVLLDVKFDEERWDKKVFKTSIEEYISNQFISDDEYKRVWTFGDDWNELQVEFLYKVKRKWLTNILHDAMIPHVQNTKTTIM